MKHFGDLVSKKRTEKGLSLFELYVECGIHPHTISKVEKTGKCSLSKAMELAVALGIESIPIFQ